MTKGWFEVTTPDRTFRARFEHGILQEHSERHHSFVGWTEATFRSWAKRHSWTLRRASSTESSDNA